MKTFVVAFISFHDNVMRMERIYVNNLTEALQQCLVNNGFQFTFENTEEELKSFAFDCDCMIGAIEI